MNVNLGDEWQILKHSVEYRARIMSNSRLQSRFHQAFYAIFLVSSRTLRDELNVKPRGELLRSLAFAIPVIIVIILVIAAIFFLIARRPKK